MVTQSVKASLEIRLNTERLAVDVNGLGLCIVTPRVRDSGVLLRV